MKISVCMATYNGEKYIARQLASILTQLDINDEVIITDDSSTDNTVEVIESLNDERLKLFKKNNYHSATYNFENALRKASGDLIFLSDQDDIWIQNKVSTILKYLKEFDLVVHDCIVIDEDCNVLNDSYFKIVNSKKGFFKNIMKNSYLGCCMAFKRNILEKCLPFPKNLIAHDIWIGLISDMIGKTLFLDSKLILYRRHTSTFTYAGRKSRNSMLFKIKYRIILTAQIFRKYCELVL